jgi:hypothetical protein
VKNITRALIFCLLTLGSCTEDFMDDGPAYVKTDTSQAINEPLEVVPQKPDPSTVYPFPNNECIECQWYFCPPLDSVWQKQICINNCEDPPVVEYEGECQEYLECDPQQYLIEIVECVTEDGYPGVQDKVCNKGQIQYTDCETNCQEESCNSIDDDCDGDIDEGQLNQCGMCGIVPTEVCDNIDNDCDGALDEDLIQQCYTECGVGYEICSKGNWVSCTAPQPQEEICDGLDNDCDGKIDEDLECVCTIQDIGVLFPCAEAPLLCGQGYKTCECVDEECTALGMSDCFAMCHWAPSQDPNDVCDPLIGMPLNEEKCNNFDDNCNQLVDEDLYASCYTGPEGTLMVGICEPGIMTCESGTWGSYDDENNFIPYFCKDEIVPQEEICNGIDDNCDGVVDWGEEMKDTDVLFIVDWSGSMSDEIDAVMIALNQFAQNYSDEEVIKWSFVRGPVAAIPNIYQERLEIQQNLIGFTDFLNSLANMDVSPQSMSTSMEMLLDAIYLSVHNITSSLTKAIADLKWLGVANPNLNVTESKPPLQSFNIDWREGADRIIIVFSDETPQSYVLPQLDVDDIKIAVAGTPQLKLFTFSRIAHQAVWEDIAIAGSGEWFQLTNNPTQMYANLIEILDDICKGGNDEE